MTNVEKNGIIMAARDDNQLAAFLNNGWAVAENGSPAGDAGEEKDHAGVDTGSQGDGHVYTRTEINTMSTERLQELAKSVGIENAEETSGIALKKKLVEHFGI